MTRNHKMLLALAFICYADILLSLPSAAAFAGILAIRYAVAVAIEEARP